MNRLSKSAPYRPTEDSFSFYKCWICGHKSNDICEFRLWQECDEEDNPEERYIITCSPHMKKGKACLKAIENHDRLYKLVPWGAPIPGTNLLTCRDCNYRKFFQCTHPKLRCNGGDGLLMQGNKPLGIGHITYNTDDPENPYRCKPFPEVYSKCEGNPYH